jgi:hypothetical protein
VFTMVAPATGFRVIKRNSLRVAEVLRFIAHSQQTRLLKQNLKVTSNEAISQIARTPIVAETRLQPIA